MWSSRIKGWRVEVGAVEQVVEVEAHTNHMLVDHISCGEAERCPAQPLDLGDHGVRIRHVDSVAVHDR